MGGNQCPITASNWEDYKPLDVHLLNKPLSIRPLKCGFYVSFSGLSDFFEYELICGERFTQFWEIFVNRRWKEFNLKIEWF